jgi:hypothetical protein
VIVGRSPQLRDRTDGGAFIVFGEPLPVGTPIVIKVDDREQHARVTEVVESADAAAAGMRVRFVSAAEQRAPAPKAAPVAAPKAAPVAAPEPAPGAAPPQAAAPVPVAAEPASQPASSSPVPMAVGEPSSGSEAVHAGDSAAHPGAHPDGEGGRRRRRRK